jgi:hypothetical protein
MNTKLGQVRFDLGGSYELNFWFGNVTAAQIHSAIVGLWSLPGIDGCYLENDRVTTLQRRISPDVAAVEGKWTLYGNATLPNGHIVACRTCCAGLKDEAPTDFVYSSTPGAKSDDSFVLLFFEIPLGALAPIYPIGGFPFDGEDHRSWREPLQNWLAFIGNGVLAQLPELPLRCAGISFEGLDFDFDRLPADFPISDPPCDRGGAYLCVRQGEIHYFPTTSFGYFKQ